MSHLETEVRTLTLLEVSAALRITRKTTLGLIGRGELVAFKVGQVWRVDAPDLEAYVEAQKCAARRRLDERPVACAR